MNTRNWDERQNETVFARMRYVVLNICILFGVIITMLFISCAGRPEENYYDNVLCHFPEYAPDSSDDTPPTIITTIPPDEAENLTPTLVIVLLLTMK